MTTGPVSFDRVGTFCLCMLAYHKLGFYFFGTSERPHSIRKTLLSTVDACLDFEFPGLFSIFYTVSFYFLHIENMNFLMILMVSNGMFVLHTDSRWCSTGYNAQCLCPSVPLWYKDSEGTCSTSSAILVLNFAHR